MAATHVIDAQHDPSIGLLAQPLRALTLAIQEKRERMLSSGCGTAASSQRVCIVGSFRKWERIEVLDRQIRALESDRAELVKEWKSPEAAAAA